MRWPAVEIGLTMAYRAHQWCNHSRCWQITTRASLCFHVEGVALAILRFNSHVTAASTATTEETRTVVVPGQTKRTCSKRSSRFTLMTQEEMAIRAMTCRGRRRKNGDSNRHNGGDDDSCDLFSYPGGPRTATAAGLPSTSPARPMASSLKGSINYNDPNRNVHTRAETAAARAPGRRREVNPEQRDSEEEAVGASSAATDDAEELALPPSRLNPRALGHR